MEWLIRNRRLVQSDLDTIRELIESEGSLGRTHLSRRLCRLWEWRQPNGAYREIACRDLLRQLVRRCLIRLPAALHEPLRGSHFTLRAVNGYGFLNILLVDLNFI